LRTTAGAVEREEFGLNACYIAIDLFVYYRFAGTTQ